MSDIPSPDTLRTRLAAGYYRTPERSGAFARDLGAIARDLGALVPALPEARRVELLQLLTFATQDTPDSPRILAIYEALAVTLGGYLADPVEAYLRTREVSAAASQAHYDTWGALYLRAGITDDRAQTHEPLLDLTAEWCVDAGALYTLYGNGTRTAVGRVLARRREGRYVYFRVETENEGYEGPDDPLHLERLAIRAAVQER